jgi:hypothetical protein
MDKVMIKTTNKATAKAATTKGKLTNNPTKAVKKVISATAAKGRNLKPISKAKPKAVKVVKVLDYKVNVLNTNKALKQETKTLNGCIKLLKLLSKDTKVLAQLDLIPFGTLKKKVRKSKAGNYSPFYLLQAVYKIANS